LLHYILYEMSISSNGCCKLLCTH